MIGRRLLPVLLLAACRAAPLPPEARWPAGTGFDAKTLVVDGTPIRYIDAGAGPAVVLIHGFAASMYAWRHTIGPLAAAGYRVVAFDDRGFGFSARPATGYANADYVGIGPVFGSDSKGDAGTAIGVSGFERLKGLVDHPAVAVGGITADRAMQIVMHGATGVAVINAIFSAENPEQATRGIASAIET